MGCSLSALTTDDGLFSGVVQSFSEKGCLILGAGGLLRAGRAASCLLQPEVGDRVLVALLEDGAWILAVLTRKKARGTLLLPAHTRTRLDCLEIDAQRCFVQGRTLRIQVKALVLRGALMLQYFKSIRTVCATLWQKVTGLSESHVGRRRVHCEQSLRIRAESADIKARTYLDLDADHIKVG